jgi:hypothetical protein
MDRIILRKQFVKVLMVSQGRMLELQLGILVKKFHANRQEKGLVQELSEC